MLAVYWNIMCMQEILLWTLSYILTETLSQSLPRSRWLVFFYQASYAWNKCSRATIQILNNNQSVNLIPKMRSWDHRITNFLSLILELRNKCWDHTHWWLCSLVCVILQNQNVSCSRFVSLASASARMSFALWLLIMIHLAETPCTVTKYIWLSTPISIK